VGQYEKKMAEKIAYVKASISPINQVYALGVPRTLHANTTVFTANTIPRIVSLLTEEGFSRFENSDRPATSCDPRFVARGLWNGNELGQIGCYFSRDSAAYFSDQHKHAISCTIESDYDGVSILPISELKAQGFTPDQIDAGYKKIQKTYPFIQNDGLPPKDTEIVILRPMGKLKPTKSIHLNADKLVNISLIDNSELHPSWGRNPD
jgi:hypothetical protein